MRRFSHAKAGLKTGFDDPIGETLTGFLLGYFGTYVPQKKETA